MMLGDVILGQIMDDDVRRHGRPREAVFYGLAAVLARLSGWLSAESFVLLTRLFGDVSGERPGSNPDGMFRFFMIVLPGVMFLLMVSLAGWLWRILSAAQPASMTPIAPMSDVTE